MAQKVQPLPWDGSIVLAKHISQALKRAASIVANVLEELNRTEGVPFFGAKSATPTVGWLHCSCQEHFTGTIPGNRRAI